MPPGFEWDPVKAELNFLKHGVTFYEASTAFADVHSFTIDDLEHSGEEERFLHLGRSYAGRILVVAHTDRGDLLRLIAAWIAQPHHRRAYEHGLG